MAKGHKQAKPTVRQEMSGVERLGLRVSSMINHPITQSPNRPGAAVGNDSSAGQRWGSRVGGGDERAGRNRWH